MINLQVYIKSSTGKFEQIELFNDESVTLTQSIQNIKDISKIFTDFTKTFNVPASKSNNRILQHFYSPDVLNYNVGKKLEGKLFLNHQLFKKGKIELTGASLKDNKAHTYKLTFYGDTIKLPDLIGDDTLQSLPYLSNIEFEYNATTVKTYLQDGLDVFANGEEHADAMIIPLISHTKRLFYDSTQDVADSGNLHYGGSENKGVLFNDLKPALRIHYLIRAIEDKYNITFDTGFFNTSNSVYYDLYMWMHVNKGKLLVDTAGITQPPLVLVKDFLASNNASFDNPANILGDDYWQFRVPTDAPLQHRIDINVETDNTNYNVLLYNNGQLYKNTGLFNVSGTQRLTAYTGGLPADALSINAGFVGVFQIFIQSTEDADFNFTVNLTENIYEYAVSGEFGEVVDTTNGSWRINDQLTFTGQASSSDEFTFNATKHVPNMKVMDFLTGLFKMFNLTAFVDDKDIINVTTLDTFYNNSKNTWDITDYVDTKDTSVSRKTPYKGVKLQYEGLDTFFAIHHKTFFGTDWGTELYLSEDRLEGQTYEVSLPFEHHKYERLIDDDGTITDVQWGWSVNDDLESVIGKPLIFYPHKVSSGTAISFQESAGTKESLSNYYIPLNHRLPTTDSQTLHFSLEPSEYAIGADQTPFTKSLFRSYYETYILDSFNIRNRLYDLKAYLPLRILLNLSLADKVVIFGNLYKINTIKTNFSTGLSSLELINHISDFKFDPNVDVLADSVDKPFIYVDSTKVTVDNAVNV